MENEYIGSQNITINDRKKTVITGVKKLDAFDEQEFSVETTMGYIKISGSGLSLEGMDMDKGVLVIKGTLDSLRYTGKEKSDNKESFIKKIFK